jgi:hypothetical protein
MLRDNLLKLIGTKFDIFGMTGALRTVDIIQMQEREILFTQIRLNP